MKGKTIGTSGVGAGSSAVLTRSRPCSGSLLGTDAGNLYRVASQRPGQRDVPAGIFLKVVEVLVINLEDLALAYQNVFAATFDASQRAVFV